MSGGDDFLSRWSRRKLEAKRPDPSEVPAPDQDSERTRSAAEQAPEEPGDAEPPPGLPDPETLTAESDLSAFLRNGIPERLRNAALRRMWSLDPSIRDFVGDARDYAYDWNTPGDVPGFGPILPSDDVEGMVAAIFGMGKSSEPGSERPSAGASGPASPEIPEGTASPHGIDADPESATAPVQDAAAHAQPEAPAAVASSPGPDPTREPVHEIASPPPEARLRRHGGAKPV